MKTILNVKRVLLREFVSMNAGRGRRLYCCTIILFTNFFLLIFSSKTGYSYPIITFLVMFSCLSQVWRGCGLLSDLSQYLQAIRLRGENLQQLQPRSGLQQVHRSRLLLHLPRTVSAGGGERRDEETLETNNTSEN